MQLINCFTVVEEKTSFFFKKCYLIIICIGRANLGQVSGGEEQLIIIYIGRANLGQVSGGEELDFATLVVEHEPLVILLLPAYEETVKKIVLNIKALHNDYEDTSF